MSDNSLLSAFRQNLYTSVPLTLLATLGFAAVAGTFGGLLLLLDALTTHVGVWAAAIVFVAVYASITAFGIALIDTHFEDSKQSSRRGRVRVTLFRHYEPKHAK